MSAFVMSHGRNMLIMKIVGYAEDVIHYYKLEDFQANIWIGHQRYPTKGRVWHPGGAHPFMGLDEALVHNGDFANYYSVTEYLGQKGITPLFLTDTEVSVLLFDLLNRVYGYPLEYILEALAPTTERDFHLLSRGEAEDLPGDPVDASAAFAGRAVVLHHQPQRPLQRPAAADRHHGHVDAAAAGLRPGRGRDAGRPDRLREAGHRLRPGQPVQGRVQVGAAAGGHVLERQGRKPHGWRRVHLHSGQGRARKGQGAGLHQQVRRTGHRPGRRVTTWQEDAVMSGIPARSRDVRSGGPMLASGVQDGFGVWKEAVARASRQGGDERHLLPVFEGVERRRMSRRDWHFSRWPWTDGIRPASFAAAGCCPC